MCGIAGIMCFDDQPIGDDRPGVLLEHLRHRGPDEQRILALPHCTLIHARLAIIDPATGHQPMCDPPMDITDGRGARPTEATGLAVVFNGAIYNHRALRHELEQSGHVFHSDHSDTEVLLHGYRQWGEKLPERLQGMFAFAIWDAKQRQLFLARDRIGQKPLYLRRTERELCFASLPSALAAVSASATPPAVNRAALHTYLQVGYGFDDSLLASITELPPATWMRIDAAGQSTQDCYWSPQACSAKEPHPRSLPLPWVGLKEALRDAVAARLEADVPLGCFLSGGIDSSLIAALAQEHLRASGGDPLRTFSVAMPDAGYDESLHAQAVAAHLGTEHRTLEAQPTGIIDDLEAMMRVMGEPTADSSLLPTLTLCRSTRQHVKVALSGDGGDELFAGYDRYRAMRLLAAHGWWLRHIPVAARRDADPRSRRTRLRRLIEAARAGDDPAAQYASMIHLFTPEQIQALLPDGTGDDMAPATADWPGEADASRAARLWDLAHYLPFELLRKLDRASMSVALEVRCPMLDARVCELAFALPSEMLTPGNQPKGLLRRLAADYLPVSITTRPKRGFAVPLAHWLRTSLRDDLADRLFDGSLSTLGIAEQPVRQMFDDHMRQRADHSHRLFALLQLSLWVRIQKPQSSQMRSC